MGGFLALAELEVVRLVLLETRQGASFAVQLAIIFRLIAVNEAHFPPLPTHQRVRLDLRQGLRLLRS